jgi:hypothetical protein
MKTMLTRSGSAVSRYSVLSVSVSDDVAAICMQLVSDSRNAPRGSRSGSLRDMETRLLRDVEGERPVALERVVRLAMLARQAGADLSGTSAMFTDLFAPEIELLPPSLADAIDDETIAQCECDPVEVRARAWNGTETVTDYDRLIAGFRRHRDRIATAIKVATRQKLRLLRGGVTA